MIAKSVMFLRTASEIWSDLEERFGYASMAQVYSLEQQLIDMNQGDKSVTEFFTEIKTVWDAIEEAHPLPYCTCNNCTCNLTKKIYQRQQEKMVLQFMMKLNDQYATIRGNLLMMQTLPKVTEAFRLFAQEERHKELSNIANHSDSLALASNKFGSNFQKFGSNFQNQNSPPRSDSYKVPSSFSSYSGAGYKRPSKGGANYFCTHCQIPSHSVDRCFKLHGFSPGFKGFKDNKIATMSFGEGSSTNNHAESIPAGGSVQASQYQQFIMCYMFLHDFKYNLISVHKLCRDMNCELHFTSDECFLSCQKGNLIPLGSGRSGLYNVGDKKVIESSLSQNVSSGSACLSAVEDAKLWHLRLGHLPFSQIKLIRPECDVTACMQNTFCQVCPVAKQTRSSFPISSIKTSAVFELIHIDVWGPHAVKTPSGSN
ncbi:uncharacterized protein LOC110690580 [Chenopodium quinoa]|uniref:uncharacterized protein LOC110690580 n=1 Tax=Chenopodium quinoa TaxID=63459 RepID=UPI000B7940F7|nr:uncharacterized protein LOC110690580 [Chenopodium quinoa]